MNETENINPMKECENFIYMIKQPRREEKFGDLLRKIMHDLFLIATRSAGEEIFDDIDNTRNQILDDFLWYKGNAENNDISTYVKNRMQTAYKSTLDGIKNRIRNNKQTYNNISIDSVSTECPWSFAQLMTEFPYKLAYTITNKLSR